MPNTINKECLLEEGGFHKIYLCRVCHLAVVNAMMHKKSFSLSIDDIIRSCTNKSCALCETSHEKNYLSKIVIKVSKIGHNNLHQCTIIPKDMKPVENEGMKFDNNKLRFDLIPPEIEQWLAEILSYGANKYAPNNWKKVEIDRYIAAMRRHLNAWQLGEDKDQESGFHHLKHMMCNAAFICYLELHNKE